MGLRLVQTGIKSGTADRIFSQSRGLTPGWRLSPGPGLESSGPLLATSTMEPLIHGKAPQPPGGSPTTASSKGPIRLDLRLHLCSPLEMFTMPKPRFSLNAGETLNFGKQSRSQGAGAGDLAWRSCAQFASNGSGSGSEGGGLHCLRISGPLPSMAPRFLAVPRQARAQHALDGSAPLRTDFYPRTASPLHCSSLWPQPGSVQGP